MRGKRGSFNRQDVASCFNLCPLCRQEEAERELARRKEEEKRKAQEIAKQKADAAARKQEDER